MEMDPKKLFPGKPRFPGTEPKFGFDTCVAFCNPTLNFYRSCPPTCIRFCPTFCQFLPPPPPSPSIRTDSNEHHHKLHHTLVTPVFISMFVLLAAAFVIAISYLIYSFFSSSLSDPSQSRRQRSDRITEFDQSIDVLNFHPAWYIATVGLQRSMIESIGMCEYKKGDGLVQGTSCSVCLAEFEDGEALRLLPKCCHGFHVPCIDTWLVSHTTCPVCRALVLQANNSFQPREAQVVEIVDEPSSSGVELERETREEGEKGEEWRQLRRAASMDDSLCVELGEKINTSSSGFNSLGERCHSCTSKLLSSGRNGFG